MKNFLLLFFVFMFTLTTSYADNFPNLKYKPLQNKSRILYNQDNDSWINKAPKRNKEAYIKTKNKENNTYSYAKKDGSNAFETGCNYEFINEGKLMGFSDSDLKLYEFSLKNGGLTKTEVPIEEVSKYFPHCKIIKISEFNTNTNSIKFKKGIGDVKILIVNDTDNVFDNYKFFSGNTKFETYDISGFITVKSKGMLQFSPSIKNEQERPWFVLLIR